MGLYWSRSSCQETIEARRQSVHQMYIQWHFVCVWIISARIPLGTRADIIHTQQNAAVQLIHTYTHTVTADMQCNFLCSNELI